MIIYKITNTQNNKVYIGQTRRTLHERKLDHKYKPKGVLGKAFKKYGMDSFKFEMVDDTARDLDELNSMEIAYIKKYDSLVPNGYNIRTGGDCNKIHPKTVEKIKQSKHYPIDCKCLKTGVTYSFYNATYAGEFLGTRSTNITAAIRRGRISGGFYWKKRGETFPVDVKMYAHNNRRKHIKKGRKLTEQHKDNIRNSLKGRSRPYHVNKNVKEGIVKAVGRPIYDNLGNKYSSISEAAEKNSIQSSNIGKVLRGKRNHTGGLKFFYVNKEEL